MTEILHRQPFLADLASSVLAPASALSPSDGQLRSSGVSGVYVGDRRVVSVCVLTLDGEEPAPIGAQSEPGSARFVSTPRNLGDGGADPTVLVERRRILATDGVTEQITVTSYARTTIVTGLGVELGCDLADISAVKSGEPVAALPATATAQGLCWSAPDGSTSELSASPGFRREEEFLIWPLIVEPGASAVIELTWRISGGAPLQFGGSLARCFASPSVGTGDIRLARMLDQALDDLTGLQLTDGEDRFLAAGAPWFLTLFGRDSIWAARMMLPLGTELAAGTLRALARRQGRVIDPATAEEPGKILHEVRRTDTEHGSHRSLPPLYYGTVDATPLWIVLLHEAWRWGMSGEVVEALLPNLERALAWLRDHGSGPNGFLQYIDTSGHGLTNQGWKDSDDSIQFRTGELAEAPVALCEVQAYAFQAAMCGAALLDAFGRPGGDDWRAWADALRTRFRDRFWIEDPDGAYPAIALDGRGRKVDTVTSNLGHLLGTGLLNDAETELVVRRLGAADMDCGFGLRTMSAASAGFNPVSYHGGSVWTHDTAIAITGLSRVGTPSAQAVAARLIGGLLRAAPAFGYRMPELHAGEQYRPGRVPLPYPAACRPQAWSAASAVALLAALVGVRPDVPAGTVGFAPIEPSPVGDLRVSGLRVAGEALAVAVSAGGELRDVELPDGLRRG